MRLADHALWVCLLLIISLCMRACSLSTYGLAMRLASVNALQRAFVAVRGKFDSVRTLGANLLHFSTSCPDYLG